MSPSTSQPETNPTTKPRPWPFREARSTGTECTPLLAAILASGPVTEMSAVDNFANVEASLSHASTVDGRTLRADIFWVHPAGRWGPFRPTEEGGVKQHGVLVTVERGAKIEEVMRVVRASLPEDGTVHVHIAAS